MIKYRPIVAFYRLLIIYSRGSNFTEYYLCIVSIIEMEMHFNYYM